MALYTHPEFIDTVWLQALWMRRETAVVGGFRSLTLGTASSPMDALRELSNIADATDPARLMIETAILDGDVEEGVGLTLTVRFLAFADTEEGLGEIMAPAHAGLEGALWSTSSLIQAVRPDAAVTAIIADAFTAAGRTMIADPPSLPFADFGNVTQRVPSAIIGVGRPEGWGFHRDHGVEQFAGTAGKELADSIATVVGLAIVRLTEPVGSVQAAAGRPQNT